jgi:surfactin synthase thioesterase subunit
VKSQGYEIASRIGEVGKYTLEKNKLYGGTGSIPYQQAWGVQKIAPEKYFGKEIVIYGFSVQSHPIQKRDKNTKNGVNVYIMLSDGKIIGGYSCPNANAIGVSYYSIDGRTLEEVTGLSFQQWQENCKKKYGS